MDKEKPIKVYVPFEAEESFFCFFFFGWFVADYELFVFRGSFFSLILTYICTAQRDI